MSTQRKTINGQPYIFEITMIPYEGKPFVMNPYTVVELFLSNDILHWPTTGYVVYQNSNEAVEKQIDPVKLMGQVPMREIVDEVTMKPYTEPPYFFRNDGKDKIHIRVKPEPIDTNEKGKLEQFPDDIWLIDLVANIYDKEDLPANDLSTKLKKLFFWDEKYQKLFERNLHWSTATSFSNPNKEQASSTSDENRKMKTGEAIKDILERELSFEVDTESFDLGIAKLFHVSRNGESAWETVKYLLDAHVAEKSPNKDRLKDFCVFECDRYTKKFMLTPLSKFFEKAGSEAEAPGEYQIEHFFVDTVAGTSDGSAPIILFLAPLNRNASQDDMLKKDIKQFKLKKYQFVDMSGKDSTETMVTTPVYTYNHRDKTFVVASKESQISDLPEKFLERYVDDKLLADRTGPGSLVTLNRIKTQNLKINPIFNAVPNYELILKKGAGSLMHDALYRNQTIAFDIEGSTSRRVGRFIGIDKLQGGNFDFDYKFYGQWFMTRVSHLFTTDKYVTTVIAIKAHSYKKITLNQSATVE